MNSDNIKKDILGQIDSSINNLSHFNEQFTQYKAQNFQDMDDIPTSEQTLLKLFNRTKKNFTGIPTTGNEMTRAKPRKHQPKSSKSEYYRKSSHKPSNESSYEPSKESSIDDNKETNIVSTKKSSGKFSDKQNQKDEKNSREL
jgi:hypothetical protein